MQDHATSFGAVQESNRSLRKPGKYTCDRCGWSWTPRPNAPDPPRACARCRSAYWQSAPVTSRANSPNDPKWQAEQESIARRRKERHLARLKELAAEFGFAPPPIRDDLSIAPPVFWVPSELFLRPSAPVGSKVTAESEAVSSPSTPATERPLSLSEQFARIRAAESKV